MFNTNKLAAVVVSALIAGVSGCNLEPKYRAAAVTFDPGLVGIWEIEKKDADKDKPSVLVEFQARALKVEDGRIRPDKPDEAAGVAPNGYLVKMTEGESRTVHELGAFLLPAGDQTLIGFQWTGGPSGAFLHPLHHVVKLTRTGDRLEFRHPKYDVVWMPGAQPLDVPEVKERPVPTIADLESRKKGGTFVTYDIDRMLEVYKARAGDPAFWADEGIVATRRWTPPPPPPPHPREK